MFCSLFFSHLVGLFYRTIRMIENGIKPVYVFDGKPPQLKSSEVNLWIKEYSWIKLMAFINVLPI